MTALGSRSHCAAGRKSRVEACALGGDAAESERGSARAEDAGRGLRAGSVVAVLSGAVEGSVLGQVRGPRENDRETVHRKSVKSGLGDVQALMEPGSDKESVATSRSAGQQRGSHGRRAACVQPMQEQATQALAELEARAQRLAAVQRPPERSTAATKWSQARRTAQEAASLELWGSEFGDLNGAYRYVPLEGKEQGPPAYQHKACPDKWLYVARSGSWWLSNEEAMSHRTQKGWLRSDAIEPGTLPHEVDIWEVPSAGEWEPRPSLRFWLSERVAVEWQQLRVSVFQAPVVRVQGVLDAFVDGLYDFVPAEGGPGEPPVFQHQQRPNLWLFLAGDQRWWIGPTHSKEAKDDKGIVHSAAVQPGTHPAGASGWHVRTGQIWEECKSVKLQAITDASCARDQWARARLGARSLQLWGKADFHGTYDVWAGSDSDATEPPVYQCRGDPDVWLYVAMDGRWWLSDTSCKDQRKAGGWLRSDVVDPGMLPLDVYSWREPKAGSWVVNPMLRVLLPEAVHGEWRGACESALEAPVIQVTGVSGPRYDGMYDLLDVKGFEAEPPTYQHQINQELFLYVATDGRWWVGSAEAMQSRAGIGRMRSDVIQPGMLPTHTEIGWHVFNRSSKEWEAQDSVRVS